MFLFHDLAALGVSAGLIYTRDVGHHSGGWWANPDYEAWVEPAYSPEGKARMVHYYRVFCDPGWAPMLPRGEVYDRGKTPPGWRTFSELHGWSPSREQAPFLREAGS